MKFENLKLAEKYAAIVVEIKNPNPDWRFRVMQDEDDKNVLHWNDNNWAFAKFEFKPTHIKITTHWSKFTYIIKRAPNGGATLSYDGAFAGFLEQNMIPTFTPDLRADMQVEDSDGRKLSLSKYMKTKERIPRALWDLQNQIKAEEAQAEERARQREILRQLRRKG